MSEFRGKISRFVSHQKKCVSPIQMLHGWVKATRAKDRAVKAKDRVSYSDTYFVQLFNIHWTLPLANKTH